MTTTAQPRPRVAPSINLFFQSILNHQNHEDNFLNRQRLRQPCDVFIHSLTSIRTITGINSCSASFDLSRSLFPFPSQHESALRFWVGMDLSVSRDPTDFTTDPIRPKTKRPSLMSIRGTLSRTALPRSLLNQNLNGSGSSSRRSSVVFSWLGCIGAWMQDTVSLRQSHVRKRHATPSC